MPPAKMCSQGFALTFMFMYTIGVCDAAVCGNFYSGQNDPNSTRDYLESNTGKSYLMTDGNYNFGCCGVITKWQAYLGRTGTIVYQVWRPVSASTYKLVGENSYTALSIGEQDTGIIPANQRITIISTDVMGWCGYLGFGNRLFNVVPVLYREIKRGWTSGLDMVTYDNGTVWGWGWGSSFSAANGNMLLSTGDLSVGITQNWSSATVRNSRSYGIRADYTRNDDPSFTNLPASVTISKDQSVGSVLHTISFTDPNPDDVDGLIVTLTTTSSYFSFDSSTTYQVTVAGTLTYAVGTYPLVFKVRDICPNTATGTLTIKVTNQPPVIRNLPSSTELSEDTATEMLLFTINVTDPNLIDTVTCSLSNSSVPFLVRQVSGTSDMGIFVRNNPNFSYDTWKTYELNISCSDGTDTVTGAFTVFLLRNQPPIITNLASSVLVSSTQTAGYIVYTVISLDPESDQLYYNKTCSRPVCPFQILHSGIVQLTTDLRNTTALGYDLSIYVYDGKTLVGPRVLTIIITGINSAPAITNLPLASALSVHEGTALGTPVFNVSVSDLNIEDNHTFTMTSTPGSGMNYFSINSRSGVVSTSSNIIDYESIPTRSYNLSITVSDGTDQNTKTLVIDISNVNEAPLFAQSFYSISASEAGRGTLLPDPGFMIFDPDAGDTYTYSQNCGNATGYFTMSPSTGRLNFSTDYDLDTGSMPSSVMCNVTVIDAGGLTGTTSLFIKISDLNDNVPVFIPSTYNFFVSYYSTTATTIGSVTVSDADVGTYGSITLTLNQTSLGSEYFAVTSEGNIYTQKSVRQIGAGNTCVIDILATDGGGIVTTATVTIAISVTTTVPTTTPVTGYRTFIQDSRNVVWISLCGVIGVLIVGVTFWVLCKINREGAPKFNCRRRNEKRISPKAQSQKIELQQKPQEGEKRWRSLYERTSKVK